MNTQCSFWNTYSSEVLKVDIYNFISTGLCFLYMYLLVSILDSSWILGIIGLSGTKIWLKVLCSIWIFQYFCQTVSTSTQRGNAILGTVDTEENLSSSKKRAKVAVTQPCYFILRDEVNFLRIKSST